METPPPWPPPIGARVRSPSGQLLEVIALGHDARLGEHVVLRGWQTFPVTREAWLGSRYEVMDDE